MRIRWEQAAIAAVTLAVIGLAAAEPLRQALTRPHAAGLGPQLAVLDEEALDLAAETLATEPDALSLAQWEARLEALLDAVDGFDAGDPAAFELWHAIAYVADLVAADELIDEAIDAMADLVAVDPGLLELVDEPAWKAALSDYLPGELVLKNPRGAVVAVGGLKVDGVDAELSVPGADLPAEIEVDGVRCGMLKPGQRIVLVVDDIARLHLADGTTIACEDTAKPVAGPIRAPAAPSEVLGVAPVLPDGPELPPCRTETRMVSVEKDGMLGNVVGEMVVNEPCRPVE